MSAQLPERATAARDQAFGYRRGLVLGLTLAETVLLLTFVVLLLLVIGVARRDKALEQGRAEVEAATSLRQALGTSDLTEATARLEQLAELTKAAADAGFEWNDDFIRLVKDVVATINENRAVVEAVQDLAAKKGELARQLAAIPDLKEPEGVQREIERLTEALAERSAELHQTAGQVNELSRRLGGVLPSCWVTDGRPEYIFDVVLASNGVRLRDRVGAHRRDLFGTLFLLAPTPEQPFSPEAFSEATRLLFNYSKEHECRFYVVVYDGTGPDEKARYKELMATVEDHFYKLQVRDAPPF